MRIRESLLLGFFSICLCSVTKAQRTISEATIRYSVILQEEGDSTRQDLLKGATHTCYIKGPNSRIDLQTPLGKQTTIIQGKTGNVVLLKEYGSQHYMIRLTPSQWDEENENFNNSKLELLPDTTTILGYSCQKAVVTTNDGTSFIVWYTKAIVPAYREFQQMGKTLPGLMMEYEAQLGSLKIRFRISQLLINPVPQVLFDIPTKGYRVLSYEESKRAGTD
jgi:GLPGLI family protein